MAQSGEKSKNFKILAQIYNDPKEYKDNIAETVRRYFSDSKKVETWLARAILFGIFQFKNQIFQPYQRPKAERSLTLSAPSVTQDLLGLSQKDTDQDGLSDFDELNIYGTSPYLPDSDSDGISDQQEIARGADPNCPQGNNCFALSELQQGQSVEPSPSVLSGQASASELRALLQQSGLPADSLNSFSDADILSIYQEALGSGEAGSNPASPTVDLPSGAIENLSADQIRQLLQEQGGISAEILNQISDQELMQLVQGILQPSQ